MSNSLPYFLLKNGIQCDYPSISDDLSADVVILGGGFTGVLMAFQCVLDGFNTILIDNNHVGLSPTTSSSGFLFSEIDILMGQLSKQIGIEDASLLHHECLNAINKLKQIINDYDIDCDLQIKDTLHFASLKKDAKLLHEEYTLRLKNNIPVQWLNTNELGIMYGIYNTHGGIITPHNIGFDPLKFIIKLLGVAKSKGLRIFDHTKISKVVSATRTVTLTTDRKNIIKAKKLMYCNSYLDLPEPVKAHIYKVNNYLMVTESLKINDMLYMRDLFLKNYDSNYFYLGITNEQRVLTGIATNEVDVTGDEFDLLDKKLRLHLPELNTRPDFKWDTFYMKSIDNLPLMGTYNNIQSTYYVVPTGSNGYVYSIMAMKVLHDFMHNKPNTLGKLFALDRF